MSTTLTIRLDDEATYISEDDLLPGKVQWNALNDNHLHEAPTVATTVRPWLVDVAPAALDGDATIVRRLGMDSNCSEFGPVYLPIFAKLSS